MITDSTGVWVWCLCLIIEIAAFVGYTFGRAGYSILNEMIQEHHARLGIIERDIHHLKIEVLRNLQEGGRQNGAE